MARQTRRRQAIPEGIQARADAAPPAGPPLPPPLTPAEAAAEQWAGDIRERCQQASGDAGLALCDLLLEDAAREDPARPGVPGSMLLPENTAWRVLVGLMEGYAGLQERGAKEYDELKRYKKAAAVRSKDADDRWKRRAREMFDRGLKPVAIHDELRKKHGIHLGLHTVQNYVSDLRRGK
jgi:hypothetical protein